MLRHLKPKKIIEGGSGFSSALMLDTVEMFLPSSTHFTFIDPNPERLLALLKGKAAKNLIIKQPVQEVSLSIFDELEANDILFIDSIHISRTGSDGHFLIFEVLPRLKKCPHSLS